MTVQVPTITIASGSSSPWAIPQSWDSIDIGGVHYGPKLGQLGAQIGGKVRIRRASRFYKVDIKNPSGSDGWTITYRGVQPKKFEIIFSIWTQSQYDYFTDSVVPAMLYSGVKNQVYPIGIYHPSLVPLGIDTIFVEDIGAVEQVTDDLMYECKVQVAEYLQPPPKNTTATPVSTKTTNQPTSPGVQAPTAIQQRINVANRLRADLAGVPANFVGPI